MSAAQKTTLERIWINHSINMIRSGPQHDGLDTEYVRADLQQDLAVQFAEWMMGQLYNITHGSLSGKSTADLYQIFLTERAQNNLPGAL